MIVKGLLAVSFVGFPPHKRRLLFATSDITQVFWITELPRYLVTSSWIVGGGSSHNKCLKLGATIELSL